MARLPVYCPNCKSIFPSRFFKLEGEIKHFAVQDVHENCPVCGFRHAKVSEGDFNITNDAIEVISGPDITVAMVKAFAEIARRTAAGEIKPEEAVAEANAISPKLGFLLGNGLANGLSTVALLSSLAATYLAYSGNKSSDVAAEKLLGAVTEQTYVLKDMQKQIAGQNRGPQPTEAKAQQHGSTKKSELKSTPKGSRRAGVNHERRKRLKHRRTGFGGARTH